MFRKLTSKRDPQATIGTELRKEFGALFGRLEAQSHRMAGRYPRPILAAMLLCILFSGVLAFTVMRQSKPGPLPISSAKTQDGSPGIGRILQTTAALQEVWAIQSQVSGLLKKKQLDAADSLLLRRALARIDSIQSGLGRSAHQPSTNH